MPSAVTTVQGSRAAAEDRAGAGVSPGDSIGGRYVVEEVLGSGGMGVVVAARHEALGHRVAMKLVSASMSADANAFVRFSREARIIASLESDHVVRVVDFGMHAGTPYMVMELLSGRDLGAELRTRGALPVAEAADYVIQACDGLSVAHAKGIVHRDVKLANLFAAMRADGERVIKVLDFGVSKLQVDAQDDVQLTRTTAMIGSPLYMSPEQIRDPRNVDARADVWSLGIVLYKLLTNEAPFDGLSANAVCAAIAADPPAPLEAHAPHVPERLRATVLRCLEKRREQRYPNVAALARDLAPFASPRGRAIADALALRATEDGVLDVGLGELPSSEQVVSADGSGVVERRSRVPSSRSRIVWGGVAALIAVGATLAVTATLRAQNPSAAAVAEPQSAPTFVEPSIAATTEAAGPASPPASPSIAASSAAAPSAAKEPTQPSASAPFAARAHPSAAPKRGAGPTGPVVPSRSAAAPTTHFGGSALDDHH